MSLDLSWHLSSFTNLCSFGKTFLKWQHVVAGTVDYTYHPACLQYIRHCIFVHHIVNITAAVARDAESPAVLWIRQSLWVIFHFEQAVWFGAAWLRESHRQRLISIGHENHTWTINNPSIPTCQARAAACGFHKSRRVTRVCNLKWISVNAACCMFTTLIILRFDPRKH